MPGSQISAATEYRTHTAQLQPSLPPLSGARRPQLAGMPVQHTSGSSAGSEVSAHKVKNALNFCTATGTSVS